MAATPDPPMTAVTNKVSRYFTEVRLLGSYGVWYGGGKPTVGRCHNFESGCWFPKGEVSEG